MNFIEVYSSSKTHEIALIKSFLEAEQIPYFIDGENFVQTYGYALPVKVRVASMRADEARTIIEEFISSDGNSAV